MVYSLSNLGSSQFVRHSRFFRKVNLQAALDDYENLFTD